MRVLVINHSSALDHLGGSERSTLRLLDDWSALDPDLELRFVSKAPAGLFAAELDARGWDYLLLPYTGWAIPPHENEPARLLEQSLRNAKATQSIVDSLRESPVDLVVTNTLVAPWGALAAGIVGIPHAWFVREFGDLDHGLEFLLGRERTLRDIGTLSSTVVANSQAIRDHLKPYVPDEKLSICYPVVDAEAIVERSNETTSVDPFSVPGALRVTVTGRLTSTKGQHHVLEAVGILADEGTAVELCLVGATIERGFDDALRRRAVELGVADRVHILGELPNPFPIVAAADVCVTPSTSEAFGRTTLEYLSLGKPVVAANAAGSAEVIVDGVCGRLVDAEDLPQSLASALREYATSRELLRQHGDAAVLRAKELAEGPTSNTAAIDRMIAAAKSRPAPLPAFLEYWLALPSQVESAGGLRPIQQAARRELLRRRVRRAVTDPIGVIRSRMRRPGA